MTKFKSLISMLMIFTIALFIIVKVFFQERLYNTKLIIPEEK